LSAKDELAGLFTIDRPGRVCTRHGHAADAGADEAVVGAAVVVGAGDLADAAAASADQDVVGVEPCPTRIGAGSSAAAASKA
jgi:hypothetical protein